MSGSYVMLKQMPPQGLEERQEKSDTREKSSTWA